MLRGVFVCTPYACRMDDDVHLDIMRAVSLIHPAGCTTQYSGGKTRTPDKCFAFDTWHGILQVFSHKKLFSLLINLEARAYIPASMPPSTSDPIYMKLLKQMSELGFQANVAVITGKECARDELFFVGITLMVLNHFGKGSSCCRRRRKMRDCCCRGRESVRDESRVGCDTSRFEVDDILAVCRFLARAACGCNLGSQSPIPRRHVWRAAGFRKPEYAPVPSLYECKKLLLYINGVGGGRYPVLSSPQISINIFDKRYTIALLVARGERPFEEACISGCTRITRAKARSPSHQSMMESQNQTSPKKQKHRAYHRRQQP